MLSSRRMSRALAIACATPAFAVAQAALAMPTDPAGVAVHPVTKTPTTPTAPEAPARDEDQTLALVLSGTALLVALGTAGYAGRKGHRTAQPSH